MEGGRGTQGEQSLSLEHKIQQRCENDGKRVRIRFNMFFSLLKTFKMILFWYDPVLSLRQFMNICNIKLLNHKACETAKYVCFFSISLGFDQQ